MARHGRPGGRGRGSWRGGRVWRQNADFSSLSRRRSRRFHAAACGVCAAAAECGERRAAPALRIARRRLPGRHVCTAACVSHAPRAPRPLTRPGGAQAPATARCVPRSAACRAFAALPASCRAPSQCAATRAPWRRPPSPVRARSARADARDANASWAPRILRRGAVQAALWCLVDASVRRFFAAAGAPGGKPRALISVYDKTGLIELGKARRPPRRESPAALGVARRVWARRLQGVLTPREPPPPHRA